MFATSDLELTGVLTTHDYTAASGNTLTHSSCPSCGTQVMAQSSARPQFRMVRLGFLDEPHGLRPQMAIWIDDAPEWAVIDAALEQHGGQPPAPVASVSQ